MYESSFYSTVSQGWQPPAGSHNDKSTEVTRACAADSLLCLVPNAAFPATFPQSLCCSSFHMATRAHLHLIIRSLIYSPQSISCWGRIPHAHSWQKGCPPESNNTSTVPSSSAQVEVLSAYSWVNSRCPSAYALPYIR